jgi:hypothetical protein
MGVERNGMSDTNDATTGTTSAEGEGSQSGTPDQKPTEGQDPIALARKRQAGAEAARQEAEKQRDAALKELEKFQSAQRSEADKELADMAKLRERLDQAEKRAAEAELKAEARVLDARFPKARAELPEVTDEVRLAKFEAILADDASADEKDPPKPQNPNESNRSASGDATAAAPKPETSEDIKARLKQMGMPSSW